MKNKLIKVISWRIISILITLILLYVITNNIKAATGVAVLLHCFLTAAHFAFETLWEMHEDR